MLTSICCKPVLATTESLWIEGEALAQLEKVQQLSNVLKTYGMPDLHPGRGIPIGACALTYEGFYPHLIGTDIGCGMSAYYIPQERLKAKKVHQIQLDHWMKETLSYQDHLTPHDLTLLDRAQQHHLEQLGSIGSGNHFIELLQVDDILDTAYLTEKAPFIQPKGYVLLIHSGSRSFGEFCARSWTDAFGAQFAKAHTSQAQDWMNLYEQALYFAKLNRALLAKRFFGLLHIDEDQVQLVVDHYHNYLESVDQLQTFDPELYASLPECPKDLFLHRKGASSTLHTFCILPSARGQASYLLAPNLNTTIYANSLAHGAGRKWKRSDCKVRLKNFDMQTLLSPSKNNKNYNALVMDKDLVYEEAHQAYKPIDSVVDTLQHLDMAQAVVKMQPLLTIKA